MNSGSPFFAMAKVIEGETHQYDITIYSTDALSHNHWGWMTQCHDMDTLTFNGADEIALNGPPDSRILSTRGRGARQILDEIVGHQYRGVEDHDFDPREGDAGKIFIPRTEWLKKQLNLYVGAKKSIEKAKTSIVSKNRT